MGTEDDGGAVTKKPGPFSRKLSVWFESWVNRATPCQENTMPDTPQWRPSSSIVAFFLVLVLLSSSFKGVTLWEFSGETGQGKGLPLPTL